MIARRTLLGAGLALPALHPALSQSGEWPNRPIRFIVPFPPSGSTDVMSRIYGEQLQGRLGQNILIENRPGAGGNIGMDAVAKAPADGYTFGMATIGQFSINQFLYSRMPWDIDRDFIPVALTYELPNVVIVSSQHCPARTLQEFIAWARARPQGISYGSPGVGTTAHLCGGLLTSRLKLNAEHVPFRGAAQITPAMLSGDLTCAIDNLASYVPIIQEGRMRAFAVTSAERWPSLPELPTMAEAGMPDFVVTSWAALVAPAATPRVAVDRMNAALKSVAEDPVVQRRALQTGTKLLWSTPEGAVDRGKSERPMWQEAVRITGARAD
ncbi:Bug family tripartite tricarboxylate transporter substrate binding protein [Pararoseomonas indoligenes]|uniref:Tripartite tricarboxylate transporter substrate binding protein n=1 Tax=Roseomonas indoligenes TaxID=2820811 RepID=A0A940MU94_9PROT|nr:tripartite tricarboxylate transporter substrate binding protein [Pararoseomonas indoligenes]MBP0491357.1 tripartite tricarboxylate transporter substrate binding protein [Pararoseomonas indoligenes]